MLGREKASTRINSKTDSKLQERVNKMSRKHRNYLVTGANRGIGLEFTRQLLFQGHHVIATARSPFNAKDLQGLNREYDKLLLVEQLDVADDASVHALVARLGDRHIDSLINNSGVLLGHVDSFEEASVVEMQRSFDVNALGPLRVTRALLPNLLRGDRPVVANITSLMGSVADNQSGGAYGYRMSKAALNMFTKNLARDYPDLTSICLHPGWVQTEMGGQNALITPEESVRGMLQVIARVTRDDSGSFFNFKDQALPW